jgi:hypothetical protein
MPSIGSYDVAIVGKARCTGVSGPLQLPAGPAPRGEEVRARRPLVVIGFKRCEPDVRCRGTGRSCRSVFSAGVSLAVLCCDSPIRNPSLAQAFPPALSTDAGLDSLRGRSWFVLASGSGDCTRRMVTRPQQRCGGCADG